MQYLNKIRFIEIRFRKITKREIKGNHKKERKLYCPKGEGLRNKFFSDYSFIYCKVGKFS